MNAKEAARKLAEYLRGLPDFLIVRCKDRDHMGAIIVDAMLQAGANFDGVRERVNEMLKYPNARTTSGFLQLLAEIPVHSLLNWEGQKPRWVLRMACFFKKESIETRSNLREWLEASGDAYKLFLLPGVKDKTFDYLKKLAGIPNTAMDRHWHVCFEHAGIPFESYSQAKEIADLAADEMGVDRSALDSSVWRYFRERYRGRYCS